MFLRLRSNPAELPEPVKNHHHVTVAGQAHNLTGAQAAILIRANDQGGLRPNAIADLTVRALITRGFMYRTHGRFQLTELGIQLRAILKHRAGRDGRTTRETP